MTAVPLAIVAVIEDVEPEMVGLEVEVVGRTVWVV
jgi:hypothetical protein